MSAEVEARWILLIGGPDLLRQRNNDLWKDSEIYPPPPSEADLQVAVIDTIAIAIDHREARIATLEARLAVAVEALKYECRCGEEPGHYTCGACQALAEIKESK